VFAGNPRAWAQPAGIAAEDARLRAHVADTGLPVFVHAPYLVNVASPDRALRERSASLVSYCLRRGTEIGARGVVVHAGSAIEAASSGAALLRVRECLLPVLDAIGADEPELLIEPMAGQGQMLCARIADISDYLGALDWHPRANLCLDTCHLFAAGHDLSAPGGVDSMLAELAAVAPGRFRLCHANDSKDACGSLRDRHQSIGGGQLGTAAFADLLRHPATDGVPFVVETPGGQQAHAADIAALRRLRDASHEAARGSGSVETAGPAHNGGPSPSRS
jgi:deoxyribonuclease IV